MLILNDPRSDLEGAYQEGIQLRDNMDQHRELINVSLRSDDISPELIKEKLRNFDLVHFAGHADYDPQNPANSGWRLTHGEFNAQDILKMVGTKTMPALVFSNACQSARTEEWTIDTGFQEGIFGLANAFLLAGVKHYVGTFWEILDEPSRRFALAFYDHLLKGSSVGLALRDARQALIREYGEDTIVWASYLLYGDPTFNYRQQISTKAQQPEAPAESIEVPLEKEAPGVEIRAGEEVIDFAEPEGERPRRLWPWLAAAIIVVILATGWGYRSHAKRSIVRQENLLQVQYRQGKFDQALETAAALIRKAPKGRLGYLVRGDIHLSQGDLTAAQADYQRAVQASGGTPDQEARALAGLGRVASLNQKTPEALEFYRRAAETAPGQGRAYLSQALLLDAGGDTAAALEMLVQAGQTAPDDRVVAALAREAHQKMALSRDQEKQARIDGLVQELLDAMRQPSEAPKGDGWTSMPLTLWVMNMENSGYALQEGQSRLIEIGLADQMLQHGRVQVVERALLDKLLTELKLGTSDLADRNTALSLGRILAARLMVSGRVIYDGPQAQVALRLIETETGRITAVVSQTFGGNEPAGPVSAKLAAELLAKLDQGYPLRGKIARVEGDDITLNIGSQAGVVAGQRFHVKGRADTLEVIAVQAESSLAQAADTANYKAGQRVEIQAED